MRSRRAIGRVLDGVVREDRERDRSRTAEWTEDAGFARRRKRKREPVPRRRQRRADDGDAPEGATILGDVDAQAGVGVMHFGTRDLLEARQFVRGDRTPDLQRIVRRQDEWCGVIPPEACIDRRARRAPRDDRGRHADCKHRDRAD